MCFQVFVAVALLWFCYWIYSNTIANLAVQDKKTGFGFLSVESGFAIQASLGTFVMDYAPGVSRYLDVFWIGVVNTFILAFVGIILSTILGFIIGVFRLSSNIVLRGFATVYIEILRNVPLLLQILFWYIAVLLGTLPDKRGSVSLLWGYLGEINVTGLYWPRPVPGDGFGMVMLAFLAALVICFFVRRWAKKRQAATGQPFPIFWASIGIILTITLVTFWVMGSPLELNMPFFKEDGSKIKRGFQAGHGMVIKVEFIAMLLALTLYTSSFIAEIVRAGILAVPGGQTEAAKALGMRPTPTLNLIIIPQAMRVIIPPLTSQFLNLTKNSSLAVAIAYPDIVSVFAGTALNQVGQELEMIFMMMMVYLTFSISTSVFMNWFNSKMRLVER